MRAHNSKFYFPPREHSVGAPSAVPFLSPFSPPEPSSQKENLPTDILLSFFFFALPIYYLRFHHHLLYQVTKKELTRGIYIARV